MKHGSLTEHLDTKYYSYFGTFLSTWSKHLDNHRSEESKFTLIEKNICERRNVQSSFCV